MAKDKFPQWLNLNSVVQTSANGYKESETQVPVRLGALEVMEILGISYEISGGKYDGIDGDISSDIIAHLSRKTQSAVIAMNDPDCIEKIRLRQSTQYPEAVETGGAGSALEMTKFVDFAAGGKGFLYAGSSIFSAINQDTSASSICAFNARLLYRLTKVTANELIGLVSQN